MISSAQTRSRWWMGAVALMAISVSMGGRLCSGQTPQGTATPPKANGVDATRSAGASSQGGVVLDRIVAVVNGDVILESDLDEDRRFEEIQPYRSASDSTRERLIQRAVNRALILQQAVLQGDDAVSDKELDAQLATLRKDIAACKQYHCETDDGWKRYLADHGFTVEEFSSRWRQRMELLKFISVRFRNGVKIPDADINAYYEKTMLPEYAKRNVKAPPLEAVQKRIEEVLLQQEVSALLQDWLKSLRAQGSVRMFVSGEVEP